MSKMVEPFMFGNHLHYEGMPACQTCVLENKAWEGIVADNHTYELATKIVRTKAWKAYRQAKPFDEFEHTFSLEAMEEAGYIIEDEGEPLLDTYARMEEIDLFRQELTNKQRGIIDQLLAGDESRDIADHEGYRSTGGVRYHKHVIRKKYKDFRSQ